MNNRFIGAAKNQARKKRIKNIAISVVILIELIAIAVVASYAWVETVSSIKLQTGSSAPLTVDTYVFTDAMIGKKPGTVDLGGYFKQAGDMHLAPCSSADGKNFYFPKLAANGTSGSTSYQTGANSYRKGTVSDKNTNYLSVTFRLKVDDTVDFFFNAAPASFPDDVRVSITAQSEGSNETPVTKIYANSASTAAVVNSTSSTGTGATAVESFASHIKGSGSTNRLFYVGADETKIVTINIWLQKTAMESNMAAVKALSNLVLVSSFTPRHVTLIPTPTWDVSNVTEYYYAWCWDASNGAADRLYKLELDANEHYAFDYNGTYRSTLFIRSGNANLTTANMSSYWNTTYMWNKTEDTAIPSTPVDPTFVIQSIDGGAADSDLNNKKSTGSWTDPVTVKFANVTDQSTWGSIEATSYIGTTTSTHVMEESNSSSSNHATQIHGWTGKMIKLKATANSGYRFVGWYDNAAGTGTAISTSAEYTATLSATAGGEVTYYAKFVKTYTFTINRYLDGSSSSKACGTIKINGVSSSSGTAATKTVDSGTSLTYSAAAATGYSLEGIYTLSSDGERKYAPGASDSSITLTSNTTYYARFTTNTHAVYLRRIGTTGSSTVQYANETAATSVDKTGVKYNTSVTIHANPAAGYKFVGWYTNSSGTGTAESTSADYTFTLGDANVTYYAKFEKLNDTVIYVSPRADWGDNYYIRLYQGSGTNVIDSNNGFVKADYDSNTGYYKATFSTSKTGTFYAILAKDNNHTDKVPSSGGYTGTLGTDYLFEYNQSATALTAYTNQRCIWFIDGTTNHFVGNDGAKMRINIWNGSTYDMRSIGSYCYVYDFSTGTEFSNASGVTFKRTDSSNNQWNYWNATPTSGKSQYTSTGTGSNNGSWTN